MAYYLTKVSDAVITRRIIPATSFLQGVFRISRDCRRQVIHNRRIRHRPKLNLYLYLIWKPAIMRSYIDRCSTA